MAVWIQRGNHVKQARNAGCDPVRPTDPELCTNPSRDPAAGAGAESRERLQERGVGRAAGWGATLEQRVHAVARGGWMEACQSL